MLEKSLLEMRWCDINVQDIVEGEGGEDLVGVEW